MFRLSILRVEKKVNDPPRKYVYIRCSDNKIVEWGCYARLLKKVTLSLKNTIGSKEKWLKNVIMNWLIFYLFKNNNKYKKKLDRKDLNIFTIFFLFLFFLLLLL